MDYTNLIILSVACIGGLMATSYSSLAQQKGWPVGKLFIADGVPLPVIAGVVCQYGSIILSVLVNPWWSAIIVAAIGYVGYMLLSSILKVYSQALSILLMLASLILIPIIVL